MDEKLAIPVQKIPAPIGTSAPVRQELRQTTLKTKKKIAAASKAKLESTKNN